MKKEKSKLVFRKIFQPSLKQGDYVKFFKGKVLWRVNWLGSRTFFLRAVDSWTGRYLQKEERHRIYKLSQEEIIREMCLNYPKELKEIPPRELKAFFKKYLKDKLE